MAVITRVYDTEEAAHAAVRGLEAAGLGHDEISVIGGYEAGSNAVSDASAGAAGGGSDHSEGAVAGTGATAGTVIGGGAGLLAGIGALAVPGLGPVVAAGWLVAAVTGAGVGAAAGGGAGGIVEAFTGAGHSEEEAHSYAESVRRGHYLVTARVDHERVSEAQRILSKPGTGAASDGVL